MHLASLEVQDFRCYRSAATTLPPGVVAVTGDNGQGKTSLLEAIAWLALGRSFRSVLDQALVRQGATSAIVRGEIVDRGSTRHTNVEIPEHGRHRILINGHPAHRTRDLLTGLRVTVFAPDDLQLVKGSPGERRSYLDDLLTSAAPRYASIRADYEKIVRHRNALLRGGLRDPDAAATLSVFDDQLVNTGTQLVTGRLRLLDRLVPLVDTAYRQLAGASACVEGVYEASWSPERPPAESEVADLFRSALDRERRRELDRGQSLVGPHRDEWKLTIDGRGTRTHSSQGEQRSLALALRLAAQRVVADVVGSPPVLLLDDVFSELDPDRSGALVRALPDDTQTIVTTAGVLPAGVDPALHLRVAAGLLERCSP